MRRHNFFHRWQNLLALLLIGLVVTVAVAAPVLAPPDDPTATPSEFRRVPGNFRMTPTAPGETLLGTVPGGLDVYYTLIWGTRSALKFGLTAAILTALIGVTVGAVGGFAGLCPARRLQTDRQHHVGHAGPAHGHGFRGLQRAGRHGGHADPGRGSVHPQPPTAVVDNVLTPGTRVPIRPASWLSCIMA